VDEVIAAVKRESEHRWLLPVQACAYARAGLRQDAEQLIAKIADSLAQARVFAALDDKERTMKALERAIPEGPFRIGREVEYPEFALRGDPRLEGDTEEGRIAGIGKTSARRSAFM
jgi:hypothetical protein